LLRELSCAREEGGEEEDRGREERGQGEREREASARGGGGAAGGYDGHACVAPRHRSKRFVISSRLRCETFTLL
jgi:hypothetical protein